MNTSTCYYIDFYLNEFLPFLAELNKDPWKNFAEIHQAFLKNVQFYERCKREHRIRPPRPIKIKDCIGVTITAAPEHCKKIPEIFADYAFNDLNILTGIYCIEYGGNNNDENNTHIHARFTLGDSTKRDYFVRSDPYPGSTLLGDFGNREPAPKRGLRSKLHKLFPFPTNIVLLHSNTEDLDHYIMKHGVWFDINTPL